MKTVGKLMVTLAVLTGVFYGGVIGFAQTSPVSFTIQPQWVAIGFYFGEASTKQEITQLYDRLPGYPPLSLKDLFVQWEAGTITRQKVRPALLYYIKTTGGYEAIECFRLGEWSARLLTTGSALIQAVDSNDSNAALSYMIDTEFLARQAQEFLDILPEGTSQDVIKALNNILLAGANLDVAKIVNGTATEAEKIAFSKAIVSLPDYVKSLVIALIK